MNRPKLDTIVRANVSLEMCFSLVKLESVGASV